VPGRLTAANVITSGNMTAGFLALLAVGAGHALSALVLVVVAAVCDLLDGTVARRGSGESAFGANVVSFGVVPAFALHLGPLQPLSGVGAAGCLAFLIAGAWRLARYPLVKDSACFLGLPIPVAGVLLMLLVALGTPSVLALVLVGGVSILMVSTVPFPTLATTARWVTRRRQPAQSSAKVLVDVQGNEQADEPQRSPRPRPGR
jgi:CDP-diacylglycerol--serine O-phosphatidyltransferase